MKCNNTTIFNQRKTKFEVALCIYIIMCTINECEAKICLNVRDCIARKSCNWHDCFQKIKTNRIFKKMIKCPFFLTHQFSMIFHLIISAMHEESVYT